MRKHVSRLKTTSAINQRAYKQVKQDIEEITDVRLELSKAEISRIIADLGRQRRPQEAGRKNNKL